MPATLPVVASLFHQGVLGRQKGLACFIFLSVASADLFLQFTAVVGLSVSTGLDVTRMGGEPVTPNGTCRMLLYFSDRDAHIRDILYASEAGNLCLSTA